MSPNTTPSAPRSRAAPAGWAAAAGVQTAAGEILSVVLLGMAGLFRSRHGSTSHCRPQRELRSAVPQKPGIQICGLASGDPAAISGAGRGACSSRTSSPCPCRRPLELVIRQDFAAVLRFCSFCALIYAQIFLTTSPRGSRSEPTTAAKSPDGCSGCCRALALLLPLLSCCAFGVAVLGLVAITNLQGH